jgi:hypothetical protein
MVRRRFLINTAGTTCGNRTGTLLKQATMPQSFAVRAEQAGVRIPKALHRQS